MRRVSIICLTLLAVVLVPAADSPGAGHCVRADAKGKADGSDWLNAWPELPGKLVRGDTYYVADGTYPGHFCDDDDEGFALAITIMKATAADHGTDVGWLADYGDGTATFTGAMVFTRSYYVFDGATGGGPATWTAGHGFRIHSPGSAAVGIYCTTPEGTVSDVTLRHVEIHGWDNLEEQRDVDDRLAAPPAGQAEVGRRYLVASSPGGPWADHPGAIATWNGGAWQFETPLQGWYVAVRDEVDYKKEPRSDGFYVYEGTYPQGKWVRLERCGGIIVLRALKVLGKSLDPKPPAATGLTVSHCYLHDFYGPALTMQDVKGLLWEYNRVARNISTPARPGGHVVSQGGSGLVFRHSWWEDVAGPGCLVNVVSPTRGWQVYGNVFRQSGRKGYFGPTEGLIYSYAGAAMTGARVANNTVVNMNGRTSSLGRFLAEGSEDNRVCNNLYVNCREVVYINCEHDYDWRINTPMARHDRAVHDIDEAEGNPFVDIAGPDFHLSGPAPQGGVALAAPQDADMDGRRRGADGVWDRGAFEWVAGAKTLEEVKMKVVNDIHWYGHDAFRISDAGKEIYIDPWQVPGGTPKADVIFLTHDHHDHYSEADVKKLSRAATRIVCPADLAGKIGRQALAVKPGQTVEVEGFKVTAVAAYNIGKRYHPKENGWVGFIITLSDGTTVYHAGDADFIPEMKSLKVDVAMLPVSGTYVMTADEAVQAANTFKPTVAIPMHYGAIVGTATDAETFKEGFQGETIIMQRER